MTTNSLFDSEMTFGPYPEGHFFHIEKTYKDHSMEQDTKMAEFLLIRADDEQSPMVWVVEAKQSAPNPKNPENPLKFVEFIDKIREKMTNGLTLGIAICLLRHEFAKTELPDLFQKLDLSKTKFQFILVIKGHEKSWLVPLQEELTNVLRPTAKLWALPAIPVVVMNDLMARNYGLIA